MSLEKTERKAFITMLVATTLAVLAEAGYVNLYRDAYFQNKLVTVNDVVVDACYRFTSTCKNLDDAVTSAKWHGLPEKGNIFGFRETHIVFFTTADCGGRSGRWLISTQSRDDLYFPENFRLDGINDAISSFKVLNRGINAGTLFVCSVAEKLNAGNETISEKGFDTRSHPEEQEH